MKTLRLIGKLLGLSLLVALTYSSCSDDDPVAPAEEYGFVQFKLQKKGSMAGTRSADADQLDSLAYAKKLRITLKRGTEVVEQSLELTAVAGSETEQGLWSEKCQLLKGSYLIAGYELLDNLDHTLLTYDQPATEPFEVVAGGLWVEPIAVNVRPRGLVSFRLTKDFSQIATRAAEAYRLEQVAKADVTIEHLQSGELLRFTGMRTSMEYYYESDTDKFTHSRVLCDTVVALKAGDYRATSFVLYDKSSKLLEGAMVEAENGFTVTDNGNVKADVPITMRETSAAIHDGLILKKIWDALDGPNWSYRGISGFAQGCNWEFERDIDLWVAQPGVRILEDGHVASIALGGFGAKGHMPEELGELTELRNLTIGTHDDGVGKSPINEVDPDEVAEALRADFKQIAAPAHGLDGMAKEMWQSLPEQLTAQIQSLRERGERTTQGLNARANDPNNFSSAVYSLPASIKNLQKLKTLFIANCPIAKLPDELAQLPCTDVEIYNCPNLKEIPAGLWKMPKLEMVYFVNNNGISADKLYEGLALLTRSNARRTLQGLYFMNNNLEVVPNLASVNKLGFIDMSYNRIERFEAPFGKTHNLGTLNVAGNRLSSLPRDAQGFFAGTEAIETWDFSGNQFTEFPDIFEADGYLSGTINFAMNQIASFEHGDDFRGVNTEILNLSFNRLSVFPRCIYDSGSKINYLQLRANGIRSFEEDALKGPYAYITAALDLAGNRLKELPADFNNLTFGYMSGLDLSGNAFESFAWRPMNIANLRTFIFRGQRNDEGVRCMREWPVGIYAHIGLASLYLGSNDIRKVTDYTLEKIRFFVDLTDNPNITIDLTAACPYIRAGLSYFLFDPGQDVRGCDGLVPEY